MAELMPIIKEKADLDAVLYSYGFKTYEGFADYRYKKYYRINQSDNEFAKGFNNINGIENFWGLKVRMAKYRGVHIHSFFICTSKECEFR